MKFYRFFDLDVASAEAVFKNLVKQEEKKFSGVSAGKAPAGKPQLPLDRALQKAGEIIRKSVIAEAKRGFTRLEFSPSAWKHLAELKVRVVGNTVEIYGHLFFDDTWIKRKGERDREFRRRKSSEGKMVSRRMAAGRGMARRMALTGKYGIPSSSKKYGIVGKDGIILLKSMPMQTDSLWIHPAMSKNGFIKRGVAKAWPRAWAIIQKALG